jgi:hypothetical protein
MGEKLSGNSSAKNASEREKRQGIVRGERLGKVGGKVAKIEFFEI